jgi:serine phosphatase RsbU (regulator of sigma subunit)
VNENFQLSAAAIADRIQLEVDNFSGGAHAADDRTLVVVKVL